MRADRPIGTLLLLWPTLWSLWLASEGKPSMILVFIFTVGTFLMRSLGCIINDVADKDFDGLVERTKNRPLVMGEINVQSALILAGILALLALLCLLPLNHLVWLMSVPALFLAVSYPFTKRFFPIPQLYLGIAFSFGIPMAFAATQNQVPLLAWLLFSANLCWTLAYDTIYAMADKPDDLKIGIKTSAITFGSYDAEITMLCYGLFDLLMLFIGIHIQASWVCWLAWFISLFWQWQFYLRIIPRNRQTCFLTFMDNNKIGWLWFTAIVAHFAMQA